MRLSRQFEGWLGLAQADGHDPDRLWSALEAWLAREYQVDGVFYGVYAVGVTIKALANLQEKCVWKSTFPESFLEVLAGDPLTNDRVAQCCLHHRRICFWHHEEVWVDATPVQKERRAINRRHGMDVGVSVPIFSGSGQICGGFGLRHSAQDAAAFDRLLDGRCEDLAGQLACFDAYFRHPFAKTFFGLSRQEIRVLALIASGMTVAQCGYEMKLSPKTAEAYLASARRKTRSRSTAEAVAKAVFFQMV